MALIAHRIHRLPESVMLERHELSITGELLHGLSFQECSVTFKVIKYFRLHDEKTGIYPVAVTLRFFLKAVDLTLVIEFEGAKAAARLCGRYRGKLAVGLVKRDKSADVHIPHPIAVG